ncbi:MAG: hypothetical protein K8F30_06865, partial [Taibaiella sp.]|nr:hypothetical protein [Taibaiella sp.]
ATRGNPPPLLDPFSGGGSIPLEAQRLGLEAHASDLNPIAVMINKAQIEIPPRFANMPPINPRDRQKMAGSEGWKGTAGLAADVRYYGEWMREKAWNSIGHLYPKINGETVIAWFWARTVKCPNPTCGAIMPLASTFEMSTKKGKRAWVKPVVDKIAKSVDFEMQHGDGEVPESPKAGRGVQFRCLVCGEIASEEYIKSEGRSKRMGAQMIGIVSEGQSGRNYHSVTAEQIQVAQQAVPSWQPDYEMSTHPQYMAPPRYGMTTFADLFTARQIVGLSTLSGLVNDILEEAYRDAIQAGIADDRTSLNDRGAGAYAYAEAISFYVGLGVGRQANRLSTLCFWDAGGEKVQQVFSRQALTMNWNFVEANPFSSSSGNFLGQLKYLSDAIEHLPLYKGEGFAGQQNATTAHYTQRYLYSTDPPYYDNVPYADLSDFFYVWLRRALIRIYPNVFSTLLVPKETELVADHQRLGGRETANEYFENGLKQVFRNIHDAPSSDYPLTVYYAFRSADAEDENNVSSSGWETMLEGLIQANFMVIGTWPMRTEKTGNIKKYRNALASSIVLV